MLVIKTFVAENHKKHLREPVFARLSDVMLEFFFETVHVCFIVKLDPIWLLNSDAKLDTGLSERLKDVVGRVVVATAIASLLLGTLIDHDPLFMKQVYTLLDGESTEHALIHMNHLILFEDLRGGQNSLISQFNGVARERDVPVFEDLLLHKESHALVDLFHFLRRVDPADGKAVTHSWAGPDRLRDTIDAAEFRWKMDQAVTMFDDD